MRPKSAPAEDAENAAEKESGKPDDTGRKKRLGEGEGRKGRRRDREKKAAVAPVMGVETCSSEVFGHQESFRMTGAASPSALAGSGAIEEDGRSEEATRNQPPIKPAASAPAM